MSNDKYEVKNLILIDNRCIFAGAFLMGICFLCWNYAWSGIFIPEGESPSVWFQRSGSISLVFCILAEIYFFKHLALASEILSKNSITDEDFSQLWFNNVRSYASFFVHLLTVFSTLIWGYGDVVHKMLTQ